MPGVRKLFSRAKDVRHAPKRRNRLQCRHRFGSGRGATERGRTEKTAGPDQFAGTWKDISRVTRKTGARWRIRETKRRSSAKTSRGIEWQHASQRRDGFY